MKILSANLVFKSLLLESGMNAQAALSLVCAKNAKLKLIMSITCLRSKRLFLNSRKKRLVHIASKNGLAMDITVIMDTIDMAITDTEDHHLKAREKALIGLWRNVGDYPPCLEESLRTINSSWVKMKAWSQEKLIRSMLTLKTSVTMNLDKNSLICDAKNFPTNLESQLKNTKALLRPIMNLDSDNWCDWFKTTEKDA